LFPIWAYQDGAVSKLFATETLQSRSVRGLTHVSKSIPAIASGELQLFGVASLLGLSFSEANLRSSLAPHQVAEILEFELPKPNAKLISTRLAQLWIGLHEIVTITGNNYVISKDIGDIVLAAWRPQKLRKKELEHLMTL
jgi:hypothetical protein